MLHHRIVDRFAGQGGEFRLVEAQEVEIALRLVEGGAAEGDHVGMPAGQLVEIEAGGKQEDAAVPEIVAGGEIAFGARAVGLLDEGGDVIAAVLAGKSGAAPDIAIAGFRPVGGDAEGDQGAGPRRPCRARQRRGEGGVIGDGVIGRHDQEQGGGIGRRQHERGNGGGRCGIAPDRLEDDGMRRDRDLPQLLGDDEAMLVIGDDQRRREARAIADPPHRLLQQALARKQREELLGIKRARHRPKPRPRAARQDDRRDHADLCGPCRHSPLVPSRRGADRPARRGGRVIPPPRRRHRCRAARRPGRLSRFRSPSGCAKESAIDSGTSEDGND